MHLQADFSEGEDDSDSEEGFKNTTSKDDIIEMERLRRVKTRARMSSRKDETRRSSEPDKPEMVEIVKLVPIFVNGLREDLSYKVVTGEKEKA